MSKERLSTIEEERERWLKGPVKKTLERTPERLKEFKTYSGITLRPIYTPEDVKDLDYLKDLNFPSQHPFTRGIYPLMYRTRLYTMRQYTGFGTAEETNAMFKYLLKHGETGLSIAFDLPTQMGYDPDHPLAKGEVGKVGVSISTLEDYKVLYRDVPMDKISVHIQANANAIFMLATHVAEGLARGHQPKELWGACQNEILKEIVSRGAYIYPLEPSIRLWGDVVEYCVKNMPRWQPVTICQFHIQEAGANHVTAWGLSLAIAIAYVEEMLKRGLPIDDFAFNISVWNIVCGPELFEAVCAVRAARRLWAKIMKDRFHAKRPESMSMRIFMGSGGFQMTRAEPLNNIVRGTIAALAGALAGVQAMNIQCYDEAYAIPTEEAIKMALRTEQIVAYESGVASVIDPLGGSYFVEWLTNRVEKELVSIVEDIEAKGGAVEAIRKGYMQKVIMDQAYEYQKMIERGEIVRIGENLFVTEEARVPIRTFKVRPEVERERVEYIRKYRESRDLGKVKEALEKLRKAAEGRDNLVPFVIEAVRAGATLGEMADTLREVFGVAEDLAAIV